MLNIDLLNDTTKTTFLSKGHKNGQKSTIKPVKYAHKLDILIDPVTFHSNCISSIRVAVTNFKNKITDKNQ